MLFSIQSVVSICISVFVEPAVELFAFVYFNQPSLVNEAQVKVTPFLENLQFLWAENNPASGACHFTSQRVS